MAPMLVSSALDGVSIVAMGVSTYANDLLLVVILYRGSHIVPKRSQNLLGVVQRHVPYNFKSTTRVNTFLIIDTCIGLTHGVPLPG